MIRIRELLALNLRLLFFRLTREEFNSFTSIHLTYGLVCTWIVGIGRWWDDPGAKLLQQLGLGSLVYVFVLAGIIWLLVAPFKARQEWRYEHVLTFVSLTSLPALLYAIPVERFLSIDDAIFANVIFLGAVAIWRVALYFFYLRRHAALSWFRTVVVGLLPLSAIVTSLVVLNLHRVVFDIMGGIRDSQRTAYDGEYGMLLTLTAMSVTALGPLLLLYIISVVDARRSKQRSLSF